MSLSVGARLGHYDITAKIGAGGMGEVYQATDTKRNRLIVRYRSGCPEPRVALSNSSP